MLCYIENNAEVTLYLNSIITAMAENEEEKSAVKQVRLPDLNQSVIYKRFKY